MKNVQAVVASYGRNDSNWPPCKIPQIVRIGHPGEAKRQVLDPGRPVAVDIHPDVAERVVALWVKYRARQILAKPDRLSFKRR